MIEIRPSVKPKSYSGQFGEIVSSGDSLVFFLPLTVPQDQEKPLDGGGEAVWSIM